MAHRLEITGGTRSDEDEACRLAGSAEQEASRRNQPLPPRKQDPFADVEAALRRTVPKPDPFSDVDVDVETNTKKRNPFSSR